jgi:2-polyprenyl-6-methoxyphenol hydroxylase-like FAD-dependent oxidoreductase
MANTVHSPKRLRVGIVGGSIAGCAAAVALLRTGQNVTVFESSPNELTGRGAGIGTQMSVLRALRERDLIDVDMPYFHAKGFPHVGRTTAGDRLGRTAWVAPITTELLNWGDLYRNLRKRLPDTVYHQGHEVTAAQMADGEPVVLQLADGSEQAFDVVVFADGYWSLGRRLLFPEVALQYRGYVLWRGVLEERELTESAPLEGVMTRVGYSEGYCAIYFVPGHAGSAAKGTRWVNWACYTRVSAAELSHFLTDRTGRQHTGSLPPGTMRLEEEARLKHLARANFPPYFSEIVNATQATFAQPIFSTQVPAYHKGRCCLVGDAGTLASPVTGSGVFKGMNNAMDLAEALAGHENVDDALKTWSAQQAQIGKRMIVLERQMEEALIWSIPDFARMDEAAMRTWWQEAAKLPEDLYPSSG